MTDALPIEPRWNLDQTLIWIVSRDIEEAAAASSRRDDRPRVWVFYPDEFAMPKATAIIELLHALQRSDLQARSAGADIDSDWFCDAGVWADGPQMRAYLHGSVLPRSGELDHPPGRAEPKFSSAEVIQIWPEADEQVQKPGADVSGQIVRENKIAIAKAVIDDLETAFAEWEDSGRDVRMMPKKDALTEELYEKQYRVLTRNRVRKLYDSVSHKHGVYAARGRPRLK